MGVIAHSPENKEKTLCEPHKVPIWAFWRAKRYILTLMIFLGFFNAYLLRVNISVAIVAMTQLNNVTWSDGSVHLEREFDWDTRIQGYILSSFFYGYIFTQLVGGFLSVKFGGKPIFALGIGVASILTVISPIMAKTNVYLFLVGRTGMGLFEGMIVPCSVQLYSQWAPPVEKSRICTVGISGTYFGTVIGLPLSSLLASTLGWESIFYIFGTFGCLWTILWMILIKSNPADDPWISKKELEYITDSLKDSRLIKPSLKLPWRSILTSKPVWAASIGVTCEIWGYYTMLTQLPKFMKYCLDFDLNAAGLLSALPYVAVTIVIQLSGYLTDYLVAKKLWSTTQLRKIFVGVGFTGQCIFLIISMYWLNKIATIVCIIFAVGFGGLAMSVFCVNFLDLSPNYSPVITAMANTLATVPGVVSPIMSGYIVTDESDVTRWRIIFFTTAFVYLLGSIVYVCYGRAELQPWNFKKKSEDESQDEEGNDNDAFDSDEF